MPKQSTTSLRQHLASLLHMKGAHLTFQSAVTDFPVHLRGVKPPGSPHSAWQLLEHMRLAQQDILDFSRNPAHQERKFPENYWLAGQAPSSEKAWDTSVRQSQS